MASLKHPHSHGREVAMQALYQLEIGHQSLVEVLMFRWLNQPLAAATDEFTKELVEKVSDYSDELDQVINSFSHKDGTQISTVVRCILRMGVFEMLYRETDSRIVIDDLCNLTRRYDGEESVGFVNGILDRVEKAYRKQSEARNRNDE